MKKKQRKRYGAPWKKTYLDHGGSTSCGGRVFCRSVAASDQYNPCQWKPAIYGRQIEASIFDSRLSRNPVFCYLQYRFRPHKSIPFVQDYKLVFQNPFHVQVIIHEKTVVGYVSYMSSFMYFDKDGIVVESTSRQLEGVPKVTGLDFGHIMLYQPLPVENQQVFNDLITLTMFFSNYGMK